MLNSDSAQNKQELHVQKYANCCKCSRLESNSIRMHTMCILCAYFKNLKFETSPDNNLYGNRKYVRSDLFMNGFFTNTKPTTNIRTMISLVL